MSAKLSIKGGGVGGGAGRGSAAKDKENKATAAESAQPPSGGRVN